MERDELVAALVVRCTFPATQTELACAFSGGPDSTALLLLAAAAGVRVVAHHVDHGLREGSAEEAQRAAAIAARLGAPFQLHRVQVAIGPNLEARARAARESALPDDVATGHTLDDQAETLLINLLRGSGAGGLAAMRPTPRKPLLALRRQETAALCGAFDIEVVIDPSNDDPSFRRNRIRHELLPLAEDIAGRDVAPLLARTADLCRQDDDLLETLAAALDPTDVAALVASDPAIATRALRAWLSVDGYPPSRAELERVLDVAHGRNVACELSGGLRVARSGQRLRRIATAAQ